MNILKNFLSIILGVSIFLNTNYLYANGAHVHGVSEVMMAIEDSYIDIQFKSPASDLLGFEHQARTKKEVDTVNSVNSLLAKHDSLFGFLGGNCRLADSSTNLSNIIEKEDSHKHDHEEIENHNDVIANYRFKCSSIEKLSEMTFSVFKVFPSTHEIQFVWISDKGQNMKKLTPKNNKVKLR